MPTRDELLQIANQKVAEQVIQQITNEYQSNTRLAYEAAAAGKWEDAAYHSREARRLEDEARPYVQAAQQQQAPQVQQQQSGLTPEEQAWIEANPHVWNDNEKRTEAIKAANSLLLRGYRRGSPEYLAGIEHWIGLRDADGQDALPVINDSEVARISRSKYGDVSHDEIQQGKERLAELKRYGLYRMDQTT
jgi:hypothetical protein